MEQINKITRAFRRERNRLALQESEKNPRKKLVPFRRFIGKHRRQRIKLGEATYYLSGWDGSEPGELRIATVELPNEMDVDARVAALAEFSNNLVDLPSDVVLLALWRDPGLPDELVG